MNWRAGRDEQARRVQQHKSLASHAMGPEPTPNDPSKPDNPCRGGRKRWKFSPRPSHHVYSPRPACFPQWFFGEDTKVQGVPVHATVLHAPAAEHPDRFAEAVGQEELTKQAMPVG